jgi:hypothetical protein
LNHAIAWSNEATVLQGGGTEIQQQCTLDLTGGQVVDDLGVLSVSQAFHGLELNQDLSETYEIGTISHQ